MTIRDDLLKSFFNSDKPFSLMIWVYFAVFSIPIIKREIVRDDIAWKILDLQILRVELPLPMYLLVVNVLVSLFIIYFNKLVNMYFKKRENEKNDMG